MKRPVSENERMLVCEETAAFTTSGRGSSTGVSRWSNSGIPERTFKQDLTESSRRKDGLVSFVLLRFSHTIVESIWLLLRLVSFSGIWRISAYLHDCEHDRDRDE